MLRRGVAVIFSGGFLCCRQRGMIVCIGMVLVLVASPVFAGEPQVYTDRDLEKYSDLPAYTDETISRKEAEPEQWEKNEEGLLKEEERRPGSEQGRKGGEEQPRRLKTAKESGKSDAAARKKKKT
jgi:hypothetical protein